MHVTAGQAALDQTPHPLMDFAISIPSPTLNHLLATLPAEDWQILWPNLKAVKFAIGDVLCEQGRIPRALFFPTTAIVSLVCLTVDGNCAEVAVVGHDGVVGYSLSVGGEPSPFRVVVQGAGAAYVMDPPMQVGDRLSGQMRSFTQALLAQVAQTAICNRFHSIEQQFCRRLLMGLDRSPNADLTMTHESTAILLGVRREGVTAAAQKLRRAGLIKYRRGHIDVLDRARLEAHACECYVEAKTAYVRYMPQLPRGLTGPNPWNNKSTLSQFAQASPPVGSFDFGANSSSKSSPGIVSGSSMTSAPSSRSYEDVTHVP